MSPANPFALAAEALQDTADRLSTRVLYGEPAAAPHLADVRAALAVFERLAAVKVSNEVVDAILAKQNFPPHLWYVKTQNVGDDAPVLVEREVAYILAACLECRRRNEAQP